MARLFGAQRMVLQAIQDAQGETLVFIEALPTARTAALSPEFACTGQLVETSTVPLRSTAPFAELLRASAQSGSEAAFCAAARRPTGIVDPPMKLPK